MKTRPNSRMRREPKRSSRLPTIGLTAAMASSAQATTVEIRLLDQPISLSRLGMTRPIEARATDTADKARNITRTTSHP